MFALGILLIIVGIIVFASGILGAFVEDFLFSLLLLMGGFFLIMSGIGAVGGFDSHTDHDKERYEQCIATMEATPTDGEMQNVVFCHQYVRDTQ